MTEPTEPKKNKTVLIIVAALALVGAGVYGYMKYLPEGAKEARKAEVSENLLAKAKEAEQEGDTEEALEYYQEYLEVNAEPPSNTQPVVGTVYASMGNIYFKGFKYPKAIEYLQKALDHSLQYAGKQSPELADHWFYLAAVYDKQGEVKMALDHYKNSRDIQDKLGRDTGKVDKVIDELEDYMVNAKLQSRSS
jgi:tetratricopeptide (TPR) repeat protein